jgi:diguanylate cyclase (GGDEF)-like protein/PAS domain S-box-containing protein
MNRFLLHRRYWLPPLLLWTAVVALSFLWNVHDARRNTAELAVNEGRFVFGMIQATRQWNALHGGVYGLVSAESPSNPYLDAHEKDIVTPTGRQLTLLNPAYMTRQLSEVIQEQTGIRVHITSLNPINPGNAARGWEIDALRGFDRGDKEFFAMPAAGESTALARYAAPLITRHACLQCHEKQGYRVGDIRGGITVVYPISAFIAMQSERLWQLAAAHLGIWLLLSGLTLLALRMIREQLLSLDRAKGEQDALVEQRTRELREEVRERKEAESSLRLLINFSGEGIFGVDKSGACTFCNPAAARLLGYASADALLGRDILALIRPVAAGPDGEPLARDCQALREGIPIHIEDAGFTRADGGHLPVEYRAHPIYIDGQVTGAVFTFSDITARKQSLERIWRQANYDALSQLPNRELLLDRLDRAIAQARRGGDRLAVLFIDLDRFKEANDTLGHDAGDHILRDAARRMEACLRDTDTLARLGGDEFLAVLPFVESRAAAETVAAKIVEALALPFATPAGTAGISASIGIALYPDDATTRDKLIRDADHAMYRAKDAGRNTWRTFGDEPTAHAPAEISAAASP